MNNYYLCTYNWLLQNHQSKYRLQWKHRSRQASEFASKPSSDWVKG